MTAEAQSAVSADESQQSAVGSGERTAPPSTDGERSFSYLPGTLTPAAQTSAGPTDPETADEGPDGSADADTSGARAEDPPDASSPEDRAATEWDRPPEGGADGTAPSDPATPESHADDTTPDDLSVPEQGDRPAEEHADPADQPANGRAEGVSLDRPADEDTPDRPAEDRADEMAFGDGAETADRPAEEPVDEAVSEDPGPADAVEQGSDGRVSGQDGVDPEALDRSAGSVAPGDGVGADGAGPGEGVDSGSDEPVSGGGDTEGLVDGVVAAEREPVAEDLPDDPWIRTKTAAPAEDVVEDEVVAAEVAGQLGTVVGEDSDADPAEFAAAAVLDVLRASGWADAAEATELRAESARLRELLAEVIRDHRAREASMAGVENQQLHWLVPLLRAAHGVAFGSLGAKVALRTAVQEVPPEVLASAGLRIDYGVGPEPDEER